MDQRVSILIRSAMLVVIVVGLGRIAQAQSQQQCFSQTRFCIEGQFLKFWLQNGDLPAFGYPASILTANDEGHTLSLQWFERTRFELHLENAPPYSVLLGRLGAERLEQLGRDWQTEPHARAALPSCLWFPQTNHNVCNQSDGLGFMSYWQSHGLLEEQLNAYQRSLSLFGLPLTEAHVETNATNGKPYLTQWFERARFEWHPENPDQYKVLLGLLGNELNREPLTPTGTSIQPSLTLTAAPQRKPQPTKALPTPPLPTRSPIPFTATATSALPTPPNITITPLPPAHQHHN